MDSVALNMLSRSEIQKLAQREGIKANAKSKIIIEELLKKFPKGVPALEAPVLQTSPEPRATRITMEVDDRMVGEGVLAIQCSQPTVIDEGGMEAVAHTKVARNQPGLTAIRDIQSNNAQTSSSAGSPSLPECTSVTDNGPATLAGTNTHDSRPNSHALLAERDVEDERGATDTGIRLRQPKTNPLVGGVDTPSDSAPARDATQMRSLGGDKTIAGNPTTKAVGMTRMRKPVEEHRPASVDRPMAGSARVSRYLARSDGPSPSGSSQRMTADEQLDVAHTTSNARGGLRRTTTIELEDLRGRLNASTLNVRPDEAGRLPEAQSSASDTSSVPTRETPSCTSERKGPTEVRVKLLLQEIGKKVKEAEHWRRELEDVQELQKLTNKRNKMIGEAIEEVQKRRKVAERCYMMVMKKDERLHNGTRSWRRQQPGEPEMDRSYVAEESEEQDTSDYVASSDPSLQSSDSSMEGSDEAESEA